MPPKTKQEVAAFDPGGKRPADAVSVHEKHIAHVQETLECRDEVLPNADDERTCKYKASSGQCQTNLEYMLFGL